MVMVNKSLHAAKAIIAGNSVNLMSSMTMIFAARRLQANSYPAPVETALAPARAAGAPGAS
jgi:hypothetical protein